MINLTKYKKYFLFLFDLFLWNISFYLTFGINKNSFSLAGFESLFAKCLILVNICFTIVFLLFRVYNKIWRYADIDDFFYIGISSFCSNFLFCIVSVFLDMNIGIRTYILFLLISEFSIFVSRIIYRINILTDKGFGSRNRKKRLMIIGAGDASSMVLHEIAKKSDSEYLPICIADDDRSKIGRSVAGTKIYGSTYEIPQICEREKIDIILFSIININSEEKRRILDICARTGIEVRVIPGIYETLTSGSIVPSIRNVEIEDLLGREPVIFDSKQYGSYIKNKIVLVTGGGGSIGSELCRQIADLNPKKLIILDIYENGAYDVQQELIRKHKKINLEILIASIRDSKKIDKIFSEKNVDVVFHAAAHKHVPLMESNPDEAVKNNVLGTLNLCNSSKKYKVKKFVLISTDKAVHPTSVMGATKRICELILQSMAKECTDTEFVAVRFGNVLGSSGSVIPLFKEQIKSGGPVTVTHPDIIRYFMTIPEAVSLVLTAGGIAKGGEIFVLDMGEPVKIRDLAENLIRLSGFIPNKDIKIEYIGMRPGEKLFEELLISDNCKKTENDKIYIEEPSIVDDKKLESFLSECRSGNIFYSSHLRKSLFKLISCFF